jgi:murein DD-endopeptidase MepM/ murein hydrolase activator NlpD
LAIKQGSRFFIPALILALLIPAGSASAQSQSEQQATPQQKADAAESAAQPQPVAEDRDDIIIPPAPYITKRRLYGIVIPPDAAQKAGAAPAFEPFYEERPAATSSVKIGSLFGYRRDPFTRRARFHAGVDIKAKWGDPVAASHPGTIQFAGWYHGYGNLVIVDHGGGVTTYYAHLSSFELGVGEKVGRGTIVGYAGRTGRATSPHLHYEVRLEGNPVNPLQPLALDPSNEFFVRSNPSQEKDLGELSPGATTTEKKNQ